MKKAKVYLHSSFLVDKVDPRIFGGFIEHLGRCVYEGIYSPDSVHADQDGVRSDVFDALTKLNMTAIRYPGGNMVSAYDWLDGVGPREERPVVRDLAWKSIEPNQFGTDEFITLCKKMNWQPMLAVNLGTGTPKEAGNYVEYCNCNSSTKFAQMRVDNGFPVPHKIKLWCLGNEMDADFQIGHVPACDYAIKAKQAAHIMKSVDPDIELVVCGSYSKNSETYMEWDSKVLEILGDSADYISVHRYVGNPDDNTKDYLAKSVSIEKQIMEMDAVCRFVQAKKRSSKRTFLCFDEWNVWYRNKNINGQEQFAPHLLEEIYNLEDALVVAGFLHSFIRNADKVKIANIAQIVNVIAPVMTINDDILIQSIFYPFAMFSKRCDGISMRIGLDSDTYQSDAYGLVEYIECSAILGTDKLHLFLTNRSLDEYTEVKIDFSNIQISEMLNAEIITGNDPKAFNSIENRNAVIAKNFDKIVISDKNTIIKLPPLSFVAITFQR